MKQKYVPIEKQSKRKQKEFNSSQRRDWGSINPVTRKVPNLKAYDRKKSKRRYQHEPRLDFSCTTHTPESYAQLRPVCFKSLETIMITLFFCQFE